MGMCVCVQSDVLNLNFLIGVMLQNVISYYNLHTYKQNEVLVVALVSLAAHLPQYSLTTAMNSHNTIAMNNLYTIFESKSTLAF